MKTNGQHQARKRFGQNFLTDPGIINRIVHSIHPSPNDNMVEIGPGLGALTGPLLAHNPQLQVIELDRDLIPRLRTQFFRFPELQIHQEDALRFDFSRLASAERPLRIVGNLPYNISTPLIFHLLSYPGLVADMHFMLQKEVVERMAATPGSKSYGRLSIMCQYHCEVEHLFSVPPGSFQPAPKVDSAIVRLTPFEKPPILAQNPAFLDQLVKTAFGQRRKTLRNALKLLVSSELWDELGLDSQLRPENLALKDYVLLANRIHTHNDGTLT